jgi:cell division GTPase FtsZ/DNA-directed RNA polymerase subunit RPC12/RpoP
MSTENETILVCTECGKTAPMLATLLLTLCECGGKRIMKLPDSEFVDGKFKGLGEDFEWETKRPYDPERIKQAIKELHEKGVVIADQIRGKRKRLIVFTFNNTIKLEAVDSYLKSVREQIGHSYDIIAVNGAEMSIVDTEELKVTKVL